MCVCVRIYIYIYIYIYVYMCAFLLSVPACLGLKFVVNHFKLVQNPNTLFFLLSARSLCFPISLCVLIWGSSYIRTSKRTHALLSQFYFSWIFLGFFLDFSWIFSWISRKNRNRNLTSAPLRVYTLIQLVSTCLCTYVFVCLFAWVFAWVCVRHTCLSVCLSVCLFVCMYIYLTLFIYIYCLSKCFLLLLFC